MIVIISLLWFIYFNFFNERLEWTITIYLAEISPDNEQNHFVLFPRDIINRRARVHTNNQVSRVERTARRIALSMANCISTCISSHYCRHLPTKRKCNHAERDNTPWHQVYSACPFYVRTLFLRDKIDNIIYFSLIFHTSIFAQNFCRTLNLNGISVDKYILKNVSWKWHLFQK